jgi:hypothetical protein
MIFSGIAFSQELAIDIELYLSQDAIGNNTNYFVAEARSAVWDRLTGQVIFIDPYTNVDLSVITSEVSITGDQISNTGWNFVKSSSNEGYPTLGTGVYKLSVLNSDAFIYLDYRDCNYPNYQNPPTGNDISVKYKEDENKFFIYDGIANPNTNWGNPIDNGETINIWDIKQQTVPPSENCLTGYASIG